MMRSVQHIHVGLHISHYIAMAMHSNSLDQCLVNATPSELAIMFHLQYCNMCGCLIV